MNQERDTSRYSAIVVVAKRARQIIEGSSPLVTGAGSKPVTIAIAELEAGKIEWEQKKSL